MRRLLSLAVLLLLLAAPVTAQQRGRFVLDEVLLVGVTTGSAVFQLDSIRALAVIVECVDTPSAGAVQLEEAYDSAYVGTWALIDTAVVCTGADMTLTIPVTERYMRAIRVRVSTTIVGGTVTVRLTGR